jgi:hypothetical protein
LRSLVALTAGSSVFVCHFNSRLIVHKSPPLFPILCIPRRSAYFGHLTQKFNVIPDGSVLSDLCQVRSAPQRR